MVGSSGQVYAFGDATELGGAPGAVTSISSTPDGEGYWLSGPDGGVFAFGDAPFDGSLPGIGVKVNDVVALVPSNDGNGYLLTGADGGIFAFGDAPFDGSLPGIGVHGEHRWGGVHGRRMTSVMRLRLPRRPGRPSRAQSAGHTPFGPSPWLSSGHQAQHLPDRLFLIGGFGHREVFLDLIAVAPPFLIS